MAKIYFTLIDSGKRSPENVTPNLKAGCTLVYLCYCLFCDWYIISLKVYNNIKLKKINFISTVS